MKCQLEIIRAASSSDPSSSSGLESDSTRPRALRGPADTGGEDDGDGRALPHPSREAGADAATAGRREGRAERGIGQQSVNIIE